MTDANQSVPATVGPPESSAPPAPAPVAPAPAVASSVPATAPAPASSVPPSLTAEQVGLLFQRAQRLSEIANARYGEVQNLYAEFGPQPTDARAVNVINQKTQQYAIEAQEATAAIFLSNLAQERASK